MPDKLIGMNYSEETKDYVCSMEDKEPYRGYNKKCYDRISLHPKGGNRIDGAKK